MAALLDDVVRPDVEIPERPEHLSVEAAAEWDRITPHLQQLGLISQIDRAALSAYCTNWGRHVDAEKKIAALGEAGPVMTLNSGYQQPHAWLNISNRSLELCAKFLAMFGMSPADRSRVTQSDSARGAGNQPELPGIPEKPAVGGWGNF